MTCAWCVFVSGPLLIFPVRLKRHWLCAAAQCTMSWGQRELKVNTIPFPNYCFTYITCMQWKHSAVLYVPQMVHWSQCQTRLTCRIGWCSRLHQKTQSSFMTHNRPCRLDTCPTSTTTRWVISAGKLQTRWCFGPVLFLHSLSCACSTCW